jgi:hypothetical protein
MNAFRKNRPADEALKLSAPEALLPAAEATAERGAWSARHAKFRVARGSLHRSAARGSSRVLRAGLHL